MKKLLAAVVFLSVPIWLTLGYAIHLTTPEAATAEINPETAVNATVSLHNENGVVNCSGVIIDPHYIMTNAHCVLGEHEARVGYRGMMEPLPATVVFRGSPDDVDVAVLRVNEPAPYAPIPVRCSAPVYGEEIAVIGHPFRLRWTTTWGRISHQDPVRKSKWLVSGMINPGNSGGTVHDAYGRLIAISTDMVAYQSGFRGPSGHTGISGVTALSAVCQDFYAMGFLTVEKEG